MSATLITTKKLQSGKAAKLQSGNVAKLHEINLAMFTLGNMPPGTDSYENRDVSWWAADVAADGSWSTVVSSGDIRPTVAGTHHEYDIPCVFASLRLCVEGFFTSGNMSAGTDKHEKVAKWQSCKAAGGQPCHSATLQPCYSHFRQYRQPRCHPDCGRPQSAAPAPLASMHSSAGAPAS
jgi:hypothetical protein